MSAARPETPEEVGAWLQAHGGPAGGEGPDASGRIVQRAADGSTIVQQTVPGGPARVVEVNEAGPAGGSESGPAAPAVGTARGSGMTQKELEALLAQLGTLGPNDFREETKQEDVPNPAAVDADGTPQLGVAPTIKGPVTYRTWIKPGTNQRLTVKVNADGTYEKTFQGPDPQINVTKPAGTGQRTQVEGTPTASGQADNERPRMVTRDQTGKEIESRELTPAEMTEWRQNRERSRNPGGKTDADIEAARDKDKPGPATLKPDGKGGTIAIQAMPDGTIKQTPLPDIPSEATSKYTEVRQDPSTGAWSGLTHAGQWEPIQGGPGVAGNQPLPPDMPVFRPDPNKPGLGVIEYAQQLAALRSQGKITDAQLSQWIGFAHTQAQAEASRLDTIAGAQRQLQANEITQRDADLSASTQRLGLANQATQNALDTSQKMASNFTPKSYAAMGGPLLPAVLALQDARAGAWGGLDQPPRIGTAGYPALAQLAQMGLTPSPSVQPNQLGPGNGTVPPANGAAIGPVTAGVTATNAAAINPSGANVQAANDATMAGSTAAFGALGVPPPQPAAPSGPAFLPPPAVPGQTPVADQNAPVGQQLPASMQLGILADAHASGRYPPGILQEAARQLGWL